LFEILEKRELAPNIKLIKISAPHIAEKIQPGQFVILMADEKGERIPLTVADYDRGKGTITIVFQEVGKTTKMLGAFNEGDEIPVVVGPLGNPAEIEKFGKVVCVGVGVFAAPMTLLARSFKEKGNYVIGVNIARRADLIIFEEELVPIQKRICELTRPYGVKTMVHLTPIMVDGTGMCGACRVMVGGETKFTCVDGPEFDGHQVDFDELERRKRMYLVHEKVAHMMHKRLRTEC